MKVAAPLLALLLVATNAYASSLEECAAIAEKTQLDQRAGHLKEARRAALQCSSDATCPQNVRHDCDGWLREVDAALPTILVRVEGADGKERTDAALVVDGAPISSTSLGRPIELDPGAHRIVATVGAERAEESFVARETEKNRIVTLRFAPLARPMPAASVAAWVFGALGVVSVAAFTGLAIEGQVRYDACSPDCRDEASGLELRRGLALGALGLGVVSLAVSIVFFAVHPTRTTAEGGPLVVRF